MAMASDPVIGAGVLAESYDPIDGLMTHWHTVHMGETLTGITDRGTGCRIVMTTAAFWVLVDKLERAGVRPQPSRKA